MEANVLFSDILIWLVVGVVILRLGFHLLDLLTSVVMALVKVGWVVFILVLVYLFLINTMSV
jgi:hypothetical protein